MKNKSRLSYMIIIFYDNCASFKKSKLTYKLILSKQKQDSISNPVSVSASIYSEWLVELTLTSCGVELGLTGLTSTSRNVRRTFHVPSVVSVQCFSPERSPSYPVELSSKRHRLKPFEFSPHGLTDRLRLNCEPSSPMNAFSRILVFSEQPSLEQFPTLSSLMGSMLASCPFLRIIFLGFHCP